MLKFGLLLLIVLMGAVQVAAQTEEPTAPVQLKADRLQVFWQRDINGSTQDRLQFVDTVSGETVNVDVDGRNYTLAGDGVIYADTATGRIMIAEPGRRPREHAFMQPTPLTRRIDWVVAADGKKIAWTITEVTANNQLTTVTRVANINGSDDRQILTDGPRDGIRVLPLAFGEDDRVLYMDYQPDAIGGVTPFRQYAGVFALDTDSGEQRLLPNEPGCFCGAGLGGGIFVRLELAANLEGFDVVAHNLAGNVNETIPALRLANYTQAGDVLVSPDGSRAVYALAQVRDFGGPAQFIRTVFVLVNMSDKTQTTLTTPTPIFLRPVAWTEDNSAVIFTSPLDNGTWKVNLDAGRLSKIANATYLGTIALESTL